MKKRIFCLMSGILALTVTMLIAAQAKENKRLELISKYGWIIDEENVIIEDVEIPLKFSDAVSDYADMLKNGGFNLEKYKGKVLKKYTYPVKNHVDKYAVINIFMYGNEIAAADVVVPRLDGYMHNINERKYQNAS